MELICNELVVPKQYIREINSNRCLVRAQKSWIKQLGQYGKVGGFTDNAADATNDWQQIFITVSVSVVLFLKVTSGRCLIMFLYTFSVGL